MKNLTFWKSDWFLGLMVTLVLLIASGGDLIQSGKMRALAVTGRTRLSVLPDVATFKEAGLPEYEYDSWFGIMAPAGVPKAIMDKVSQDIAAVLQQADVKARFEPQGVVLVSSRPAEFDQTIKRDADRYEPLFKTN